MPSSVEASNFQDLLARLSRAAITAVAAMWTATNQGYTQVAEQYPGTVDPYAAAAATLSAQWYQQLMPQAAFAVQTAPLPGVDALRANVGWAFTQTSPLKALAGTTERHVFKTSRDTVIGNAKRENARWARYASAHACPWCRVLATREAVYRDAENAVKGHDGCHCLAVPIRGGDTWTPPDYVAQWEDDYIAARGKVGGDLNAIVNYLRSQQT